MTDLTTVNAVKAYIGKTDPADDGLIQTLVSAYSQAVRSFTSRDFSVQSYDLWRSGRGNVSIALPQWPLVSVQGVTVDGQVIPAQASWGTYGYRFTDREIILDGAAFSWGNSNVRLQFTAGYTTIPSDIDEAVCELVALRYKMRGDNIAWTSKSLAGETISLNTKDMPAQVAMVLKQYANPVPL